MTFISFFIVDVNEAVTKMFMARGMNFVRGRNLVNRTGFLSGRDNQMSDSGHEVRPDLRFV